MERPRASGSAEFRTRFRATSHNGTVIPFPLLENEEGAGFGLGLGVGLRYSVVDSYIGITSDFENSRCSHSSSSGYAA